MKRTCSNLGITIATALVLAVTVGCVDEAATEADDAATPPADASETSDAKAANDEAPSTPFTATMKCPLPGKHPENTARVVAFRVVGPSNDARVHEASCPAAGDACRTLAMTEEWCNWEGLEFGGQTVTQSVMHGMGYMWTDAGGRMEADVTDGYDWGTAANGDSYLARWTETELYEVGENTIANWTLVYGTGSLAGITGKAKINCPVPGPDDEWEVCQLEGSYRLPG